MGILLSIIIDGTIVMYVGSSVTEHCHVPEHNEPTFSAIQ